MAKKNINIFLFTINYPFNKPLEHTFLKEEIKFLNEEFKKVIIVPLISLPNTKKANLPDYINLDLTLSENLRNISSNYKWKLFFSKILFFEILKNFKSKKKIQRAASYFLNGIVVRDWIKNIIHHDYNKENTVFYSFWNDSSTLGMALLKKQQNDIKIVSRCHNFDLYGNLENQFYVPFFKFVFKNLDVVFPDSEYGKNYILENCKNVNIENGIMGVDNPGFTIPPSNDDVFRIVSCSYLIERKRVDLFLEGLIDFAKNNQYKIEWFHIGNGPMLDKIHSQIKQLKSSVKVHLLGNLGYEDLISFYKSTPIDLFVNTSTKEGTPVSLMEAISFGIPLLVTSFGGNKEIVSNNSGFLLSQNPTPKEISEKLNEIIESDDLMIKRELCFKVWDNCYNSSKNYKLFTKKLINI